MPENEKFTLELASIKDAKPISRLSRDEIEVGLGWCWSEQRVRKCIHARDTNVVTVRVNGELVGFGIMEYRDEFAHLVLLGVSPCWRRRGIASELIEWLEETAKVYGAFEILVQLRKSNRAADSLYKKLKFEFLYEVKGYYRGRETATIMTKQLSECTNMLKQFSLSELWRAPGT